jgi:hypothetical protein
LLFRAVKQKQKLLVRLTGKTLLIRNLAIAPPADHAVARRVSNKGDLSMSENCSFFIQKFMKKLKFSISRGLDELMVSQFLDVKGGGIDFGAGIIKTHPKLKKIAFTKDTNLRKRVIKKYFANYYKINKKSIRNKIDVVKRNWYKIEKDYVDITENYFNGYKFPDGMYVAYASIINCNPRFLESKTFQFYYKKPLKEALHTIAHELLHFIFFDFVEKKLKAKTKHLTEEQLWDLSEIFNVIVLRSDLYKKIIDRKVIKSYPDHKKYLKQFEKEFKKSKNAKGFILKGLDIIK